jgi:fructose-1,6-bisphosphatase/inositol monophosphatase family enzyme
MNEQPEALWRMAKVAMDAAAEAAMFIAARRPRAVEHKDGGDSPASQVVTEVDRASEVMVLESLASVREGFGLLTEEREDDGSRLAAPAFWCIDPLDGTLAYVEGTPGPAVSIALVRRDGVPLIGVVHDVTGGNAYAAVRGGGLTVGGQRFEAPAPRGGLQVFGDRSFDAVPRYREIATVLGATAVHVGRAAVTNALAALVHPPGVYFKLPRPGRGGGSLWDFAATACCLTEAGAVATTFDGQPLPLNRPDTTFLGDCGVLFASDASVAAKVRAAADA